MSITTTVSVFTRRLGRIRELERLIQNSYKMQHDLQEQRATVDRQESSLLKFRRLCEEELARLHLLVEKEQTNVPR
jgi:hypothetical protein